MDSYGKIILNDVPEYWKDLSLEDIQYLDLEGVLCTERWLPIKGYEVEYEISDLGRVKSLARCKGTTPRGAKRFYKAKILKPILLTIGYFKVGLMKNGDQEPYNIHRLVAEHYVSNPENKPEVNHKKGIKKDNRYFELEWMTQYENIKHSKDTGLDKAIGATHYLTRFSEQDVIDIYLSPKTITELSKVYAVTIQCIWNIKNNVNWVSVTSKIKNTA